MSKDKYGKLVLDVLGAVQRSSGNQLEKDLLGAVISIETHDPNGLGAPALVTERPAEIVPAPQIAAPAPVAAEEPQKAPETAQTTLPEAPAVPAGADLTQSAVDTPAQPESPGPFKS